LEKELIQRSTFKEGTYVCESRLITMSLLRVLTELWEDYEDRT
jgi:hypothetical protein